MRRTEAKLLILLIIIAGLLLGCSYGTKLKPAPDAKTIHRNGDAAMDQVAGVTLVVEPNEWTGRAEVEAHVTPVKVTLRNNSGDAIRIRVTNFSLMNETTGEHFAALPLHAIEGSIEEPVLIDGYYAPVPRPRFYYDGFWIAPYYSDVYLGIPPYQGSFYYDPYYYRQYYSYWASRQIQLPTQHMYEEGLPDGVLKDGGRLQGFLYFEKVDRDVEIVEFRADIINADDGTILGTISIPFTVD